MCERVSLRMNCVVITAFKRTSKRVCVWFNCRFLVLLCPNKVWIELEKLFENKHTHTQNSLPRFHPSCTRFQCIYPLLATVLLPRVDTLG